MIQKIKKICLLVVAILVISGCSRVSDEDILAGRKAVENGAMIIDVRSQKEYYKGHVEGAVNIPISYVDKMYNSLPRDKELVVYCHSGARSEIAARLLREQGWTVYDVKTQEDWERKIVPKVVN